MEACLPYAAFYGPHLIAVKDKPSKADKLDSGGNKLVLPPGKLPPSKTAEFQLPGEMLSMAVRNYTRVKDPQTILALRVIGIHFMITILFLFYNTLLYCKGTQVTIYRADFPVHYLQSIKKGVPADDITIFRYY